jgi:AcrR family transcriptional regulator
MPRLSRAERRDLTTSQLLETAKAVFIDRGYHRATLDDIAEAAGFTKGAVYARFASKEDLCLALYDAWIDQRVAEIAVSAARDKSYPDVVLAPAQRMMAMRRAHADWYLVLLEFWTYAARDERLSREFAVRHNRLIQVIAGTIEKSAAAMGLTLKVPAIDLARAGSAMGHGVTLERLAGPEGAPDSLLVAMLESFSVAAASSVPLAPKPIGRHGAPRHKRGSHTDG